MRKILQWAMWTALLVGFTALPGRSQSSVAGNLTADSTDCSKTNSCIVISIPANNGGATFKLSGTFSGTVQFEVSADPPSVALADAHWVAVSATPSNSTTTVTSATSAGAWQVNTAGYVRIRIRCSTYSTGTIVAGINLSTASARMVPLSGTASAVPFSGITSGTNSSATMTCGTGCAIGTSGSGTNAAISLSAASALPNGTTATTQSASDNSTKVATTAYVDGKSRIWQGCGSRGLGDGLNAIAAGTYLQFACVNDTGSTVTLTGIHCWTDNAGTSTLNAANNAATALLTGAVTCNNTKASGGAPGTQSATVTLANGDAVSFTFVADGTSKQTNWTVSGTY